MKIHVTVTVEIISVERIVCSVAGSCWNHESSSKHIKFVFAETKQFYEIALNNLLFIITACAR